MERVFVRSLISGVPLETPLYYTRGTLLLSKGDALTESMRQSMIRSDNDFVFAGEWSVEDATRYESATPVSEYRDDAERFAQRLMREAEEAFKSAETDEKP